MRQPVLILIATVLTGWAFISNDVRLDSYDYVIEGNQPVVRWVSIVETNLDHYELHRKTRFDENFEEIAEIAPKGPRQAYSYRDTDVYKFSGETVEYELFAVSTSGVYESQGILTVNYTPTAVRRTWGSIKAMFQ